MTPHRAARNELRGIPGIGPAMAADLHALGVHRAADLRGRDPQLLYDELEEDAGAHVDRCVLYVFRCAVYWAEAGETDPVLTRWWSWKDGGEAERRGLVTPARRAATT